MTGSQTHDIEKLPKWAQKIIWALECKIDSLEDLRQAHEILMDGHHWFVLRFHESSFEGGDPRLLYFLDRNAANPLCDIGKNDIVLVGRGVKS